MQLGQNNGQWVVVDGKEILERFDSKDLAIDYLKTHQVKKEKHKHEYPDSRVYRTCVIHSPAYKGVILWEELGRYCTTCEHWDREYKDSIEFEKKIGWEIEYCLPGCRDHDHETERRRHNIS
jgi:hypothetical protein